MIASDAEDVGKLDVFIQTEVGYGEVLWAADTTVSLGIYG